MNKLTEDQFLKDIAAPPQSSERSKSGRASGAAEKLDGVNVRSLDEEILKMAPELAENNIVAIYCDRYGFVQIEGAVRERIDAVGQGVFLLGPAGILELVGPEGDLDYEELANKGYHNIEHFRHLLKQFDASIKVEVEEDRGDEGWEVYASIPHYSFRVMDGTTPGGAGALVELPTGECDS